LKNISKTLSVFKSIEDARILDDINGFNVAELDFQVDEYFLEELEEDAFTFE